LAAVYQRWRQTLKRLAIRYRKPYTAGHPSVSWDLMLGRNPLFVAKQHGHRILTMLTVYAAWTEGSLEADVVALRRAMRAPAYAARDGARHAVRYWAVSAPRRRAKGSGSKHGKRSAVRPERPLRCWKRFARRATDQAGRRSSFFPAVLALAPARAAAGHLRLGSEITLEP
jgi:hypothetical protein